MKELTNIINDPEDNINELTFYFEHLLSEDITIEEQENILRKINEKGINEFFLSSLSNVLINRLENLENISGDFIDTCGTGGSNLNIFNCSTLSSFVIAQAGGKVFKHGNKAITSKSGSADFLERSGINLNTDFKKIVSIYDSLNIGFLFAPNFHKSIRYVAEARKNIGKRTIFNVIGPLVNPTNPDFQIIGTSTLELHDPISKMLQQKNIKHGIVVTSEDGIDEFSITSASNVTEIKNGTINKWIFDPKDYGFEYTNISEIQTNTNEEAYLMGIEILNGKRCAATDMVAINSGIGLYMLNQVETIHAGISKAKSILTSGKALLLLNKYATLSEVMNILEDIVNRKKFDPKKIKELISIDQFLKLVDINQKGIFKTLTNNDDQYHIIPETKKSSPSAGVIVKEYDPLKALAYKNDGHKVISVLTEEHYFDGSIGHIKSIKSELDLKILRKDFIIDEWQIYESKAYGADCILLIAESLSKKDIAHFSNIANELNLDVLLDFITNK